MLKPWKIATNIFTYYEVIDKNGLWGKNVSFVKKNSKDFFLKLNDEEIKVSGDAKLSQMARFFDFAGLLIKSRKVRKIENYFDGTIDFSFVEAEGALDKSVAHILKRSKELFEANTENKEYISEEFRNLEAEFLFSLLTTFIYLEDKKNARFIEMTLDGTKVSDYTKWFIDYVILLNTRCPNDSVELLKIAKEKVIGNKADINEIISLQSDVKLKIEDIWMKPHLDGVINFDKYNVGLFLQNHITSMSRIKIPIYQRKYRWSEWNILQLARDIFGISPKSYHNIGTLVTKQQSVGNKVLIKVIDGQQRLTSLMIILKAAYDVSKYNGWAIDSIVAEKFKGDNIDGIVQNELTNSFLRIEGNEDFEAFIKLMSGEQNDSNYSRTIIFRNYYSVVEWMISVIKNEKEMTNYWSSLLKSLIFSTMSDATATEFSLFEKLNTGSIPLKPFELIKNKILNDYNDIVDKNEKAFQEEFQSKVLRYFEKKDGEVDDKKVKTFIINVVRSYDMEYDKNQSLYQMYNNIIESVYKNEVSESDMNLISYRQLLAIMEDDIKLFDEITNYSNFSDKKSMLYPFSDYLFSFTGRTVYMPILFKIFKQYLQTDRTLEIKNKVRSLLHVLETYEIRFQVVAYRGQSLSEDMQKIALSISIDISPKELFDMLSIELSKNVRMPSLDDFKRIFKIFDFENKLANVVTNRIENYVSFNGIEIDKEPNFSVIGDVMNISREHIMPQNKDNWIQHVKKNSTEISDAAIRREYDDLVDLIGNALPIQKWKNSELGNVSIDNKIDNYTSNATIKKLHLFNGFEIQSDDQNIVIKKVDDSFNFKTIKERTEQLANFASIIWKDI